MQATKMSIAGLIFFPGLVLGAHFVNKEISEKGYITGGKLFIATFLGTIFTILIPVGWIFGVLKKSEIEALRAQLAK